MELSRRSKAGKLVGLWALKTLERELGSRWPEDVFDATGSAPSEVFAYGYAIEFAHLLEFALRLTILRQRPGYGTVLRDLRKDLRHERKYHSVLQLEVAALAQRLEFKPVMERVTGEGGPIDVQFTTPSGELATEIRVVLRDAPSRAALASWDLLTSQLLVLEAKHRVVFGGGLDFPVPKSESDEFIAALDDLASQVAADGEPRTLRHPAGIFNVIPDAKATEVTLHGPRHTSNGWPRIASVLRAKADQASRTNATWLRIDVLDGLWQLTEWSTGGLAEKTERLAMAVTELLASSGLSGAILTSGAGLVLGEVEEVAFQTSEGAVGLRCPVAPMRVRESIIIPLRSGVDPEGAVWRKLYESETDWIPWALMACGLPSLDEVTAWELDDLAST
jgi:hypothetical protein